jgi:thiamine transport system substrate-binding protein
MHRRLISLAPAVLAALLVLPACGSGSSSGGGATTAAGGSSGSSGGSGGGGSGAPANGLTLLTYDAFTEPDALAQFTKDTGIAVKVAKSGDAGTLVNKAILTAGRPEGDVLWGVDNTLLSRAVDGKIFTPYQSSQLGELAPDAVSLVPGHEVTPVDTGDVCLNVDKGWFADKGLRPPQSFEDLIDPAYKGLLVVQNPASSSPGLAFLLATVAHFGDPGYEQFWSKLRANGVKVDEDWDTAYYSSFTAGGGQGDRPIVVSYASSPPATIYYADEPKPTTPTTASVESTCFHQVEFAGILRGTAHEAEARRLVDFLVGPDFQAELPLSNFVYPVREGVALPQLFTDFAPPVAHPLTLSPQDIALHRNEWITRWTQAVLR